MQHIPVQKATSILPSYSHLHFISPNNIHQSATPFRNPVPVWVHFLGRAGVWASNQRLSVWWSNEGLFVQSNTLVLTPFGSPVGSLNLINLAAKRRALNRVVYRRALNSIVHWNWALSRLEGWVSPRINARVVSPEQPVRGLTCLRRLHAHTHQLYLFKTPSWVLERWSRSSFCFLITHRFSSPPSSVGPVLQAPPHTASWHLSPRGSIL